MGFFENCCDSIMRLCLYIFNIVFMIIGLVFVIIGAVTLYHQEAVDEVSGVSYLPFAIALLVIGIIIMVICLIGCCGAWKYHKTLLYTYGIIILVLVIIQIAIGIYLMTSETLDADRKTKETIQESKQNYLTNKSIRSAWDMIQQNFECCGVDNFADWDISQTYGGVKGAPKSCCIEYNDCYVEPCESRDAVYEDIDCWSSNGGHSNQLYSNGCLDTIYDNIAKYKKYLGMVFIALALIQIVGIIFSFCLARSAEEFQ